ncbi:MAG: Hpt domain-containing protein [Thermodesulfobacteriota bacterium]
MLRINEVAEERGLDREDVIEFLNDFVDFTENSDLPGLKEALARSDPEAVKEKAHSIKGAAANLKLDQIASTARELEFRSKAGNLEHVQELVDDLEAGLGVLKQRLKETPPQ